MTPGSLAKITLDKEVFGPLKEKFVGLGTLMKEMWDSVMPETPDMLQGFGGRPETMVKLKKFLLKRPLGGVFTFKDRLWAIGALDKDFDAQNAQWYDGMPSVRCASHRSSISGGFITDGGAMSESKIFCDTIENVWVPPPPSPSTSASALT